MASRQSACAAAVLAAIRTISLPAGQRLADPSVAVGGGFAPLAYLREAFEESNVAHPCWIVHYADVAPTDLGHRNVTKDIGYGVAVTLCDTSPVNYQGRADEWNGWRDLLDDLLAGKRLPGVPQVYRCTFERGTPLDPRLGIYQSVYARDVIRCAYRTSSHT